MTDGSYLRPARRERGPAQSGQDLGVAPLLAAAQGAGGFGPEVAFDHPSLAGQPDQGVSHNSDAQSQRLRDISCDERAVGAREPADEVAERIVDRVEKRHRKALRWRDPEPVPQPAGIFGSCEPHDVSSAGDLDGPAGADQLGEQLA